MTPKSEMIAVEIDTVIAAQAETVFGFFTSAERFSAWLGAPVVLDPKPGGKLEVDFANYGTVVAGEIVEVTPPERIVMTWGVKSGPQAETLPPGSSTVIIELQPTDEGTRVTLRHEGLPDEKERKDHEQGWHYYLSQLRRVSIEAQVSEGLPARLDDFLRAWSETDPAARGEILQRVWADDGEFQDRFTSVAGRDALSHYIGIIQAQMSGAQIERTGDVQICGLNALFLWRATDAQGNEMGTGTDVCTLDPDGRIRKLVGFWN